MQINKKSYKKLYIKWHDEPSFYCHPNRPLNAQKLKRQCRPSWKHNTVECKRLKVYLKNKNREKEICESGSNKVAIEIWSRAARTLVSSYLRASHIFGA